MKPVLPSLADRVVLRHLRRADLDTLYAFQCDDASAAMAGVVPRTREKFDEIYERLLSSTEKPAHGTGPVSRVIVVRHDSGEEVAGSIGVFQAAIPSPDDEGSGRVLQQRVDAGEAGAEHQRDLIGYGIGRAYWGRGVASRALTLLLAEVTSRPLYARTAVENGASMRVLTKNGFTPVGTRFEPATERYIAGDVVTFVLR